MAHRLAFWSKYSYILRWCCRLVTKSKFWSRNILKTNVKDPFLVRTSQNFPQNVHFQFFVHNSVKTCVIASFKYCAESPSHGLQNGTSFMGKWNRDKKLGAENQIPIFHHKPKCTTSQAESTMTWMNFSRNHESIPWFIKRVICTCLSHQSQCSGSKVMGCPVFHNIAHENQVKNWHSFGRNSAPSYPMTLCGHVLESPWCKLLNNTPHMGNRNHGQNPEGKKCHFLHLFQNCPKNPCDGHTNMRNQFHQKFHHTFLEFFWQAFQQYPFSEGDCSVSKVEAPLVTLQAVILGPEWEWLEFFQSSQHILAPGCLILSFKTVSESSVTELLNGTLDLQMWHCGIALWSGPSGLFSWPNSTPWNPSPTSHPDKNMTPMCNTIQSHMSIWPCFQTLRSCSNFWAVTLVWKDFHIWVIFFFPMMEDSGFHFFSVKSS